MKLSRSISASVEARNNEAAAEAICEEMRKVLENGCFELDEVLEWDDVTLWDPYALLMGARVLLASALSL